jgi:hypothetical protein
LGIEVGVGVVDMSCELRDVELRGGLMRVEGLREEG